jgi:hypothetical protein
MSDSILYLLPVIFYVHPVVFLLPLTAGPRPKRKFLQLVEYSYCLHFVIYLFFTRVANPEFYSKYIFYFFKWARIKNPVYIGFQKKLKFWKV